MKRTAFLSEKDQNLRCKRLFLNPQYLKTQLWARTTVKISDIALLRGARGGVNLGINNATSPVTLHHEGCLLVYLQVLLLEQKHSNVIRI